MEEAVKSKEETKAPEKSEEQSKKSAQTSDSKNTQQQSSGAKKKRKKKDESTHAKYERVKKGNLHLADLQNLEVQSSTNWRRRKT